MRTTERGVALLITLLALAFFSVLAMGAVLASATDRLSSANHREAVSLLYAADAALELAIQELTTIADWSVVLDGSRRSTRSDGPPAGVRLLFDGTSIDLTRLTNELTCGRVTACSDAMTGASTADRPWRANNPAWALFLSTSAGALVALPPLALNAYLVTWVGDDARETDGRRSIDGGTADGSGRHVVRIRAAAFGSRGARRVVEVEAARRCRAARDVCEPGIRVQSWRILTSLLP